MHDFRAVQQLAYGRAETVAGVLGRAHHPSREPDTEEARAYLATSPAARHAS